MVSKNLSSAPPTKFISPLQNFLNTTSLSLLYKPV